MGGQDDGHRASTDLIVVHYTAGYTTAMALRAMEARTCSAHVVIERDGTLTRCVGYDRRARHSGGQWGGRGSINARSLGVELVGFGPVTGGQPPSGADRTDPERMGIRELGVDLNSPLYWRDEDGWWNGTRQTVAWSSTAPTRKDEVMDPRKAFRGTGWTTFPEVQLLVLEEVLVDWCDTYGVCAEAIIGHEHVHPEYKTDPGPAFPWSRVYQTVSEYLGGDASSPAAITCMQSHLYRLGGRPGVIDGVFGPRTQRAQGAVWAKYSGVMGWGEDAPASNNGSKWCELLVCVPGVKVGRDS